MKWQTRFAVSAVAVVLCVAGCASSSPSGGSSASSLGSLTDVLGSSLGLSSSQATGSVGSVLSLAKGKLSSSDYSKVATAVPGADQYIQKAKDAGAVPEGGIKDKSGLDAAYSKLGISPEVGKQITPVVLDYVGKAGGSTVQGLLGSVLK